MATGGNPRWALASNNLLMMPSPESAKSRPKKLAVSKRKVPCSLTSAKWKSLPRATPRALSISAKESSNSKSRTPCPILPPRSSAIAGEVPDPRLRPTISEKWATRMSHLWPADSVTGGMKAFRRPNAPLLIFCLLIASAAQAEPSRKPSTQPPPIPFGLDAITQWDRWPYLRIGVRCYMRGTFDRSGGNDNADAAHFIRQVDDTHNVVLDERGPGILWFARFNHWHGSPWQYLIDGREFVLSETSTADPVHPAKNSVFEPQSLFPPGLNYTWAATKGADLTWTPVPFESSLRIAYGHANYGTGYFTLWKVLPGLGTLSRPLQSWSQRDIVPSRVVDLLNSSGNDVAPPPSQETTNSGVFSIAPRETSQFWSTTGEPMTIRRIAFRVPAAAADHLANARLRIFWDDRPDPS